MTSSNHRLAHLALAVLLVLVGSVSLMPRQSQAASFDAGLLDLQQDQPADDGDPAIGPWRSTAGVSRSDSDRLTPLRADVITDAGISSDNFNSCVLDSTLWTESDPPGAGATFVPDGQRVQISVPAGTKYDLWAGANDAARITQEISSGAFSITAKFESGLNPIGTSQFKYQGFLVEGTTTDINGTFAEMLRFDVYSTRTPEGNVEIYALGAWVRDSSALITLWEKINPPATIGTGTYYIRVTRSLETAIGGGFDSIWTMEYSLDGTTFDKVTVVDEEGNPLPENVGFIRNFDPAGQRVGVYAGSTAIGEASAPGHTAIVDYFVAEEDPITTIPDDDTLGYDVTTDTAGQGNVTVSPGPYACGEDVTFEAEPNNGWAFLNWTGGVIGSENPKTVPFEMGLDAVANFTQAEQFALDVTVNGNGTVTSAPTGIDCGTTCSANFVEDMVVTLTASAETGSTFTGWGGAASGLDPEITVTMNAAKSVVANFTEGGSTLTVQVFPHDGSGGTIASDPVGIDCGSDCSETYALNAEVELTATANPGYAFIGWSGAASGENAVTSVTMSANRAVIATFDDKVYTIAATGNGGSITVDPVKTTYAYGDVVTLTATPAGDNTFVSWTGDLTSTDNPVTFTVGVDTDEADTNISIVAQFDGDIGQKVHLNIEAIVFPVNAPSYTDNTLISVSPDTGGVYDHGTHIDLTAARPNVNGQYCALDWYWYVPDVSPDWHLLPNHNQTIGVTMDHDKWFRAEWVCSLDEPTPTPTPTATPPPGDEMCSLTLDTSGNGSIQYGEYGSTSNAAVRMPCDEELAITAQPGPGWRFTHFEMERGVEQTTVSVSPYTWTVQDGDSIRAFFVPGADSVYLPAVRR